MFDQVSIFVRKEHKVGQVYRAVGAHGDADVLCVSFVIVCNYRVPDELVDPHDEGCVGEEELIAFGFLC